MNLRYPTFPFTNRKLCLTAASSQYEVQTAVRPCSDNPSRFVYKRSAKHVSHLATLSPFPIIISISSTFTSTQTISLGESASSVISSATSSLSSVSSRVSSIVSSASSVGTSTPTSSSAAMPTMNADGTVLGVIAGVMAVLL